MGKASCAVSGRKKAILGGSGMSTSRFIVGLGVLGLVSVAISRKKKAA
jgi:hypothetical protein